MDVFDDLVDGCGVYFVAIVTAARLPEAIVGAVLVDDLEAVQEGGRMLAEMPNGAGAYGLLDGPEDWSHLVLLPLWPDQQVSMIGHDDPGPYMEVVLDPGFQQGIDKPLTRTLFAEQRDAMITGERQVMGIPFQS